MNLRRTPATDDAATYPTLSDHGDSRRRFLKLCAMSSAAAALGLPLTGCPDVGGGGGGGTGGGGGGNIDWVPWEEHEPIRGKVAMPVGKPVAVVINDDPIAVVFSDGVSQEIVVAATVTPQLGVAVKSDFCTRVDEHVALVVKTAKAHGSNVFSDAAALEAFEGALRDALNGALTGGYVEVVSVAKVKEPQTAEPERKQAARKEAASDEKMKMRAKKAAPEKPAAPAVQGTPKTKQLWMACRTPGCTDCGGTK